jgi:hypothetical protein
VLRSKYQNDSDYETGKAGLTDSSVSSHWWHILPYLNGGHILDVLAENGKIFIPLVQFY